jgi:lysyl-tRNA synthetase class 2
MAEQDLINERLKKLAAFRAAGEDPYPSVSHRSVMTAETTVGDAFVTVAGRIRGKRGQGGVMFLDVWDESGKIQSVAREDGCADYALFRDNLDIGDFIEVSGSVFVTDRGEKSIDTKSIRLLAKSMRPLPDQWSGLEDIEIRLRKRYLDALANPEVRGLFEKKAAFWNAVRGVLAKGGFLEVDMPALELVAGGADAEPFVTHHNALDTDFSLRISLELPLKKMLVGGFERVFEIGRVFRNEGIDREHLQDYVQCEFYAAYWNYKDLMKFVERMYKAVVKKTVGSLTTSWQGHTIEWGGKWPQVDYGKIFKEKTGLDVLEAPEHELLEVGRKFGAKVWPNMGRGRMIDAVYKKAVRPTLIQPCFLINHPVELSPLAKRASKNARLTERLQIVACGSEIGNGFSELNDPVDQRARFEEQARLRLAGDSEAQQMDEEFVEALEYGMPPAAGFGLSERVFAVLMDKPVRETVVFPLMKPKTRL